MNIRGSLCWNVIPRNCYLSSYSAPTFSACLGIVPNKTEFCLDEEYALVSFVYLNCDVKGSRGLKKQIKANERSPHTL